LHTKTKPESFPWQYHYHPEYEIVCVLSGSGSRHVGNHFSNYEDGDLVLIGPNLPHAGFGLNSHGLHEEIVVQIKEDVLKNSVLSRPEMAIVSTLLEKSKYGICFKGPTKSYITKNLKKFLKLSPFDKLIELLRILHSMAISEDYELLNPSSALSNLTRKNNGRLQEILAYVEKHYNDDIDIKKAAFDCKFVYPLFLQLF
jgi:hypothetical protein